MRDYLHRLLAAEYAVDLALDGQEALEMANRHRYSVVISDVMMPGMDGFGLLLSSATIYRRVRCR